MRMKSPKKSICVTAWLFAKMIDRNRELDRGGEYHWRREGEAHIMHPEAIALLQHSVRANDYGIYKRFTQQIDDQSQRLLTLRGLLKPKVPAVARSRSMKSNRSKQSSSASAPGRCRWFDFFRSTRNLGDRDEPPGRQIEHR